MAQLRWRRGKLFLDRGLFRLAMSFRLIENAGDSRQRIVGWIALIHGSGLRTHAINIDGYNRRYRSVALLAH